MDQLLIRGGRRLQGEVTIAGAKNAALPELCAALLTDEPVCLRNVPHLQDVATMAKLLRHMGVQAQRPEAESSELHLDARSLDKPEAPYELVKTMRASILVLGPLLARAGRARVSLPGGCAIGSRPVDQHIKGLQAMGAQITVEHGYIEAQVPAALGRLQGARITTDMVTVTGTENLLMAATLAQGRTILDNAATEPEVTDLAHMLVAMGARIEGIGTRRLVIEGVERLRTPRTPRTPRASGASGESGATGAPGHTSPSSDTSAAGHDIIADRIEAGTFLCAVTATGGDVLLRGARADHLEAVIDKLREAGARIESVPEGIHIKAEGRPKAVGFRTSEYPAFPTDMQAQFMVVDCVAEGSATITETIFENRYMHVNELVRLGARITVDGHTAVVQGVPRLSGAQVMATDLRASASLVIAGLVAEGETLVQRIYHLDRGYDRMERKLRLLGADIERIKGPPV